MSIKKDIKAQTKYFQVNYLSTTCPVRNVSAEIPQGVPGGLVAAEGGGDVGRGHRGVDRHVVGGHGVASQGVGGALRCKIGGGRHGEGGETKFTKVRMKESLSCRYPLVTAKHQQFLEEVKCLGVESCHQRIEALGMLHRESFSHH